MAAWGWRIPFLIAGPLGVVALYIRLRLEDTPEFLDMREHGRLSGSPLRETMGHGRALVLVAGIGTLHATAFYLVFTYMATYLGSVVGLGADVVLTSTLLAGGAALLTLPLVGTLADRVGRRPVLLSAAVGFAVLAYPLFLMISSGTAGAAILGHVALAVLLACFISTSVTTMAELFPARIRASGVSLGYNLPAALFGGTAPFVATFLISATGIVQAPALYFTATALIACVVLLMLRETDLHDEVATRQVGKGSVPLQY